MSSKTLSHPSVIWAQRKKCVFLTLCLEDVKEAEIRTEAGGVYFKGKGGSDGKEYEAQLDLYGSIDPSSSLHVIRPRNIEFCLKKEEDNLWPRLLKSQTKYPWLKIDFNKWKDEDDSDEDESNEEHGGGGGPPGMRMGDMAGGGDRGIDFKEKMWQKKVYYTFM